MDIHITIKHYHKSWTMWVTMSKHNRSFLLAFWVSILITLILKITTICFRTNDLLECVAKLSKFHNTQVGKDQVKWSSLKNYWRTKDKWSSLKKIKNTRPSLERLFISLVLNLYIAHKWSLNGSKCFQTFFKMIQNVFVSKLIFESVQS